MKKQSILFLAAILVAALTMSSCKKNQAKDVNLVNKNDSLNYALGVANGNAIKQYYLENVGDEEAAIESFVKALDSTYGNTGATNELEEMGMQVGVGLKQQEKDGVLGFPDLKFNYTHVRQGFLDGLKSEGTMTHMEATQYVQNVMRELQNGVEGVNADSVNYAVGLANGGNVKLYYMQDGVSEEKIESMMKGVDKVMNNKNEYYELELLGENIGSSMKKQKEDGLMGLKDEAVNIDLLRQALINGIRQHDTPLTAEEADAYLQGVMRAAEEEKMLEQFGDNKKLGEDFLAENATKEGVVVLPSGLQYKIIKEGKGEKPTTANSVNVHYHGTLIDGTVFDSSVERREPISFGVTQVIRGWTEALQLMPVGSKWILYIPYDLAYGAQGSGDKILPYSALIFEVELLGIE